MNPEETVPKDLENLHMRLKEAQLMVHNLEYLAKHSEDKSWHTDVLMALSKAQIDLANANAELAMIENTRGLVK